MIKRRLKVYGILFLVLAAATTFGYFYGFANTITLCSILLHFAANRYWAKQQAKLVIQSQNILGENDKKLLARIRAVEDKLDAR